MGKPNDKLRTLLQSVIEGLVDDEAAVAVSATPSDGGGTCVLTVRVADKDVGKVIGRHGRTAQALRMLMESMAAKHKQRAVLEIVDDGRGTGTRHERSQGR